MPKHLVNILTQSSNHYLTALHGAPHQLQFFIKDILCPLIRNIPKEIMEGYNIYSTKFDFSQFISKESAETREVIIGDLGVLAHAFGVVSYQQFIRGFNDRVKLMHESDATNKSFLGPLEETPNVVSGFKAVSQAFYDVIDYIVDHYEEDGYDYSYRLPDDYCEEVIRAMTKFEQDWLTTTDFCDNAQQYNREEQIDKVRHVFWNHADYIVNNDITSVHDITKEQAIDLYMML